MYKEQNSSSQALFSCGCPEAPHMGPEMGETCPQSPSTWGETAVGRGSGTDHFFRSATLLDGTALLALGRARL